MNAYPWLEKHLSQKPGAIRDYKLEWKWDRWQVGGKLFAALCTPGPEYKEHAGRTMVIFKCDPTMAEGFRAQYPEVVPGFYSDKRHWNSIYLDGKIPDEVLKSMIDLSYNLVFGKLTKKLQREIAGE